MHSLSFFHVDLIFVPPKLQCWHWHSPPEFHEVWHWTWSSFRRIWTRIWHGSPNEQLRTRSYAKHMAHGYTWHIMERLQGGGFGGFNDDFFRGGFSLDPQIQILWIFIIQKGLLMPSIRKTVHRSVSGGGTSSFSSFSSSTGGGGGLSFLWTIVRRNRNEISIPLHRSLYYKSLHIHWKGTILKTPMNWCFIRIQIAWSFLLATCNLCDENMCVYMF